MGIGRAFPALLLFLAAGCLEPARPEAPAEPLAQYTLFVYRLWPRVEARPVERVALGQSVVNLQRALADPRLAVRRANLSYYRRPRALARYVLRQPLFAGETGATFTLWRIDPAEPNCLLVEDPATGARPHVGEPVLQWRFAAAGDDEARAAGREILVGIFGRGEF